MAVVKTLRPLQWLKNVILLAPLLFSGLLFYQPVGRFPYLITVIWAIFLFCLASSSVYLVNDVVDKKKDSQHPFKKNRPIASGMISERAAIILAMVLATLSMVGSLRLPTLFTGALLCYLGLQTMYSLWLKTLPILDVLSIAFGFVIRVYAGAAVVNLHMSVWFLLTVISASLFLAVGKRQSELTLLGGENSGLTRKTLQHYSQPLLEQYTGMFANSTWLTYAIFAFQYQFIQIDHPKELFSLFGTVLPQLLQPAKVLMITIPLVILGVMRYLQVIYEKKEGESPALVLVKDKLLLGTVVIFGVSVFLILYLADILSWLAA